MNSTDRKSAAPDTPKTNGGDGNLRKEAIMLGWIALDGLVSLALVIPGVSMLPAFQADATGVGARASEESPVGFALLLALPTFLAVGGMRRGFLNHAVGIRHARALDQIALGSAGAMLVMAIGHALYGDGHPGMFWPLNLLAFVLPAALVIFGLHYSARQEESNWAGELSEAAERSATELAAQARSAGRAWISVALLTATAAAALGVFMLVPRQGDADADEEDALVHYSVHAVTGAGDGE